MLKGRTIVVVGGGAIGGHFLQLAIDHGADCAVIARKAPKQDVPFESADITDLPGMERAVERLVSRLKRVDVAVNVAGTHHKPMDLARDDHAGMLAEFDRVLRVNTTGAFAVTMAFAKHMVRRRSGHIVHLCSNASRHSLYGSYGYNASKHALEGIIKTAAAQLAPFGVRVNGVAPGTVETDLNRDLLRSGPGGQAGPRAAAILAHTPTKRFATLDGISETLLAVCVPQRHLTGNVIFCDDGYNIEGHSWPAGTEAVYKGGDAVEQLYAALKREFPDG